LTDRFSKFQLRAGRLQPWPSLTVSTLMALAKLLRAAFAVVVVMTWSAPVLAQERPTAIDTVRLRFAWPVGTRARIETTRYRERVAERSDTTLGRASYQMSVTSHPEGLLVSHDNFVFPALGPASTNLQAVAERVGAMVPQYVVDSEGGFLRINDVSRMKALLDSMMTQLLGPVAQGPARQTLESLLSAEALTGLAAQDWNAIVGMWAGADLELGEAYELEEQAPLPMVPGAVVPMISEFSVERRTSCVEGGSDRGCVEIQLVAEPDADSMKQVLSRFMQRLAADASLGGIGFEELQVESGIVLITEPGTLLPHRVTLSRTVTGVVSAGGQRSNVSQVDVRTFKYTYAR
jgi:hypothetical protein